MRQEEITALSGNGSWITTCLRTSNSRVFKDQFIFDVREIHNLRKNANEITHLTNVHAFRTDRSVRLKNRGEEVDIPLKMRNKAAK